MVHFQFDLVHGVRRRRTEHELRFPVVLLHAVGRQIKGDFCNRSAFHVPWDAKLKRHVKRHMSLNQIEDCGREENVRQTETHADWEKTGDCSTDSPSFCLFSGTSADPRVYNWDATLSALGQDDASPPPGDSLCRCRLRCPLQCRRFLSLCLESEGKTPNAAAAPSFVFIKAIEAIAYACH